MRRRQRGFTLIEMVVTVAIVGILASAVFPLAKLTVQRAKEQDLQRALMALRDGIDRYKTLTDLGHIEKKVGESGYPQTLAKLVDGVRDSKDPNGAQIYILRRIPRDPFFPDADVEAANTWGLRSYASPADEPMPGDDIFDVYSLSTKSGLNGVPYREW